MRKRAGQLVYSPSDLVCFLKSPFASWMDRYYLENPDAVKRDEESKTDRLVAKTVIGHDTAVLSEFKRGELGVVAIQTEDTRNPVNGYKLPISSRPRLTILKAHKATTSKLDKLFSRHLTNQRG